VSLALKDTFKKHFIMFRSSCMPDYSWLVTIAM